MDDQLLVRVYNVGLGDCIYLRVPDGNKQVHILIDCGNKFEELDRLKKHLAELKKELPDAAGGKKHLDLLVVTHPHEDHHKGFDEDFFDGFDVEHVWLSPAFDFLNPDPSAEKYHALQAAALRGLRELAGKNLGETSELALDLLSLSKEETVKLLCNSLPSKYHIQPRYVTADTPKKQLKIFTDPAITLKVLGPMKEIDKYYLGGKGLLNAGDDDPALGTAEGYRALFQPEKTKDIPQLVNISVQDFKQLRDRIHASALALADLAGHVTNNLSVVLLLEWHGLRLLFTGDAEFKTAYKGQVKEKSCNGSWNVMWQERKEDLSKQVDFLKVGHHGSVTASPWVPKDANKAKPSPKDIEDHPMNLLLNSLLPLPQGEASPPAVAVVSTQRTTKWQSIPDPGLLAELGRRVADSSRRVYTETVKITEKKKTHSVQVKKIQPLRTDLETQGPDPAGEPRPYIEFISDGGGPLRRSEAG